MPTEVTGISLEGVDKAYPLDVLQEYGIIHYTFGLKNIAVVYDTGSNHVSAFL